MAISTVSSLASLFAAIYEDAIFVAREMNIMTNLVTNYATKGWMTRYMGIYPELSAVSVAEGVDFAGATEFTKTSQMELTPGEIINQVILTDRRIDTDPDDARRDAAEEMGNAIATKIDTDLVGLFTGFSTEAGAGAGSSFTLKEMGVAVSLLRNAKVPNPIVAVLHPYHWHDVWVELGTPAGTQAALGEKMNEALRSFFVSNLLGMNIFINANIAVDASDDAISAIFNRGALAFDSRKAPTLEPERDASLRAWELNFTAGYAYGERRDAFGVKLTADATAPT